ncbi:hypothetical protein DYU11_04435 [Fibrisoma montanum]|uniref:Uncharacterized protein n=1 Tax=Fibrisoma montanum TaxID=2305895 RepID=A0A418MJB5_9BACT|nr:hypothetical protein [Fibrisoma montanum]RIV27558.1 hypothetical protein DYU11_04435 [Fibrisoma montanum]
MKKSLTLLSAAAVLAFASSCNKEGAVQPQQEVSNDAGARVAAANETVVAENLPFLNEFTNANALADVVRTTDTGRLYFYLANTTDNIGRTNGAGDNPSTVTDAFSYKGVVYAYGKHYSKGNVVYTPRFNGGSLKLVDLFQTLSGAEVVNGAATIGDLRARQDGNRVRIERTTNGGQTWNNIGRTNGNTDDGTLKEFFVVNGVPFAVVQRRATQFIVITPRGDTGSVKLVDIVDNDFEIIN